MIRYTVYYFTCLPFKTMFIQLYAYSRLISAIRCFSLWKCGNLQNFLANICFELKTHYRFVFSDSLRKLFSLGGGVMVEKRDSRSPLIVSLGYVTFQVSFLPRSDTLLFHVRLTAYTVYQVAVPGGAVVLGPSCTCRRLARKGPTRIHSAYVVVLRRPSPR